MPRRQESNEAALIFTVGHSTHPLERFLELLGMHGIGALADVRSFPSSRRWPQFNQPALRESMARAGLEYHWIQKLGGRRSGTRPDSPHVAWHLPAFRAYADYADGVDFQTGLDKLTALAQRIRCAYMCSEGLWWKCHRRLISDRLLLAGWQVTHILPDGKLSAHSLPDFASVVAGRLLYDKPAQGD